MPESKIIKLSVLADGAVLVDGNVSSLDEVGRTLAAAAGAVIWYYRENPAGEPPASAMEVMKLIVANRLPVSMASKADFSDVGVNPVAEAAFAGVRKKAADRQMVIVRPDGKYLLMPAMAREAAKPEMLGLVERMLPSKVQRNVAIIGDTTWAGEGKVSLQTANQAIPFFGMLMGFACIGHAVWIFDGATELLQAGCRDADVLIVDSARTGMLDVEWQSKVSTSMRRPQVLVHDRATYQLRKP